MELSHLDEISKVLGEIREFAESGIIPYFAMQGDNRFTGQQAGQLVALLCQAHELGLELWSAVSDSFYDCAQQ